MIDYKTLNALLDELKRRNTSVDSKEFFDRKLGKSKETIKTHRITVEKIIKDGYAEKLRGNYIILTPEGAEFEGYEPQLKQGMKRVFVSHASKDHKIALKLVEKLLVEAAGVPKSQIFFSAKRDTGIPSKVAWRDHIKQELRSCKIFIALITPSYHKSQMCLGELGAAWVLNKNIYSLYLAPINTENFSAIIGEKQADNLRDNEEVRIFIDSLCKDLERLYSDYSPSTSQEKGVKEFQRGLRSILRKEAKDLGIDYLENGKKNILSPVGMPQLNLEHVKQRARLDYPEDYSMQEHIIKDQQASHTELLELIDKNTVIPEFEGILKRAISDYPNDYSMIVHIVKDQLDALSRLK